MRKHTSHPTAMFQAFARAKVVLPPKPLSRTGKPLSGAAKAAFMAKQGEASQALSGFVNRILDGMQRYLKSTGKGSSKDKRWDANLSYKTYRHLASKGVLQ